MSMNIKFYPNGSQACAQSDIQGEIINGIDLSTIPAGVTIQPMPQELTDAGIISVERGDTGELWVVLQQACLSYEYPVTSHVWKESPWIPAEQFDPNECYIIPTSVQGKHDYELVFRDTTETLPNGSKVPRRGWTVVQVQPEEPANA